MAESTGYERPFKTSAQPCPWCKKYFGHAGLNPRKTVYCSLSCSALHRYSRKPRTCTKCGVKKPMTRYAIVNGRRARACDVCRVPKGTVLPPKVIRADSPCGHCRQPIVRVAFRSRVKKLKYCGPECRRLAATHLFRVCRTCKVKRPREDYDYTSDPKARISRCRACHERKEVTRAAGIGYMQDAAHSMAQSRIIARNRKLDHTISVEAMTALYGSPCVTCGSPGCIFHRIYPELGYIDGNVTMACWVCSRWFTPQRSELSIDAVVAQAQKIVAHCV